jgi:protocatechuate 3,4-dioxygenase beta subunit
VRPEQTEGPYFVDEKLNRSDIRSDPSDSSVKEGAQLNLKVSVYRLDGASCTPLAGALVDIWHCDALGVYSDVVDTNGLFDTKGQKFLRGYQLTNEEGLVEFITIYPGWYTGRTVHVHFKIRTDPASQDAYEFTSQIYFDDSTTDQVYTQAPYDMKGQRDTTNANDGIFQQGGDELTLQVTSGPQGYEGTFEIGLKLT